MTDLLPEEGLAVPDTDGQGRQSEPERDWQGQPQADSGRDRPNDGARRRR